MLNKVICSTFTLSPPTHLSSQRSLASCHFSEIILSNGPGDPLITCLLVLILLDLSLACANAASSCPNVLSGLRNLNTELSRFSPYLYDCSSASLPSFSVLLTRLFLGPSFQEFKLLIFLLALLFPLYSQDAPHQNTQSHVSSSSSNPFLFCPNLDPFHLPNNDHPAILKSLQPHLPDSSHAARPSWRCTRVLTWRPMAFMPLNILFLSLDRALKLQISTECHILCEAFSTPPKNIQFLLSAPKALCIYQ